MRVPALPLWFGLMVSLALVPGAAAQPAESEEVRDDPHEGRFVYLSLRGTRSRLQASSLYAVALVPGHDRT